MSAYHVPRGTSVEHKHRIPAFRELKSLVGEAEINQIITLKKKTHYRGAWHPVGLLQVTGT